MAHPSRIACLRIPGFQIAVHQKLDPALKGKPVAVVRGKGSRDCIVQCSAEAGRRNVQAGMKLAQARALCNDLAWCHYDQDLYNRAQKELANQLFAVSPRVTARGTGIFLLDAGGLKHLGGERKFCRNVQRTVNRAGYAQLSTGIADSAFAALVASRTRRRQFAIIPPGMDAEFLSRLPVSNLPVSAELLDSLDHLGVKLMGQLVELPVDEVAARFAEEGLRAHRLARGIDDSMPNLPVEERQFSCLLDLDRPVELLNETQFVLKSMLDRLTFELKAGGFQAEELTIRFFNEALMIDKRVLALIRPSNQPKFLLEVTRLSLESKPLTREFTAVALAASKFTAEEWHQLSCTPNAANGAQGQTGLKQSCESRFSESLAFLLQKFVSRLGASAVVRSMPNDQHLPEHAGAWLPVVATNISRDVLPVNIEYMRGKVGASQMASGLVLRRATASPVLVEFEGSRPVAVTYNGRWHKIREITTPERLSGLWWDTPERKSYYVALIESGDESFLVLLVQDHQSGSWLIEGFFD